MSKSGLLANILSLVYSSFYSVTTDYWCPYSLLLGTGWYRIVYLLVNYYTGVGTTPGTVYRIIKKTSIGLFPLDFISVIPKTNCSFKD